jgi:esterase/lipase superfamily enzyme
MIHFLSMLKPHLLRRFCVRAWVLVSALWPLLAFSAEAVGPDVGDLSDPSWQSRKDAYCARFDENLSPTLVAESERMLAQIQGLSDEEFSSPRAEALKRSYLEQLHKIQDANSGLPLECKKFAAVPDEREYLSIGMRLLFLTDRQIEKAPYLPGGTGFGAKRAPTGVAGGTVRVDLNWGGRCKDSEVLRTWILSNSKRAMQMRMPIVVGHVEPVDANGLNARIREFKDGVRMKRPVNAIVFVHGFNVNFVDAAATAAQIANCMKGDVLPVVVSWPSAGAMTSYLEDEESVGASRERMRETFKWLLTHPDIDEITLVAHSMGTRLVTRLLADLNLAGEKLPKLSRVALAAPDLGEEEFEEYWKRIAPIPSKGWTLYVSNSDLALWASTFAHRRPRIGDSRTRTFTIKGAETVNASVAAPTKRALGHSYVVDSTPVSEDLRGWVTDNKKPKDRGLKLHVSKPEDYWDIVAPQVP